MPEPDCFLPLSAVSTTVGLGQSAIYERMASGSLLASRNVGGMIRIPIATALEFEARVLHPTALAQPEMPEVTPKPPTPSAILALRNERVLRRFKRPG